MSEQPASTSTVPQSPGERDAAAQAADAADLHVAGADEAAAGVSSGTVEAATDGDAVVSGGDADELVSEADAEATMPPPPPATTSDPGQAPPPSPSLAQLSGEVEVECPGCGLVLVGESPRPTAAWFCPRCDYPLFWAAPPPADTPPSARARRRLPGTGGRAVVGSEACWYCGEMNEPGTTTCFRCAATLPKPTPPSPSAPAPVGAPVAVPVPVPFPTASWPYVTAGVLAGLSLGISTTLWLVGLG